MQLQVFDHELYRGTSRKTSKSVASSCQAPRGMIFDSRGRKLAVSVEVDSVWADPSQIDRPAETAQALGGVIGVDVAKLSESLARDREFIWVARQPRPA